LIWATIPPVGYLCPSRADDLSSARSPVLRRPDIAGRHHLPWRTDNTIAATQ